jgi:hypothetical protein
MSKKPTLKSGSPVFVKINGEITPAVYQDWSDKYNLAIVMVGTKRLYRKLIEVDGLKSEVETAGAAPVDEVGKKVEDLEDFEPKHVEIKSRTAYEATRLKKGDIVEYKGLRCRVTRVSDCAAELAVPQSSREIITRDGRSGYVKGGVRTERISPNSEIPILNR